MVSMYKEDMHTTINISAHGGVHLELIATPIFA